MPTGGRLPRRRRRLRCHGVVPDADEFDVQRLTWSWLDDHGDELRPDRFLLSARSGGTNVFEFDVCEWYPTRDSALDAADRRGLLCVLDCESGVEIPAALGRAAD
ncbi:hypothetical protein FXW78_51170 [Rhodococcus opacus]|nr:hypothetical protein [Rhodococcus opacus]